MKPHTITRWIAGFAMNLAAVLFLGSIAATLGHVAGVWPKPDLDLGRGLPNLPTMAMILFLAGMFGVVLVNRKG